MSATATPSVAAAVATPWYREPWPWLLMLGPAIVVVAGFITLYYAIDSYDGLVSDDYYKRGLAVNQDLSRRARAESLAVAATLRHDAPQRKVEATISARGELPPFVTLRLKHPTRAGQDHRIVLSRTLPLQSPAIFSGGALIPALSKWDVQLEGKDWLVAGEWSNTAQTPLKLGTVHTERAP